MRNAICGMLSIEVLSVVYAPFVRRSYLFCPFIVKRHDVSAIDRKVPTYGLMLPSGL